MQLKYVIQTTIIFLSTLTFNMANAAECGDKVADPKNDTTVLFINGIANNRNDACYASLMLKEKLLINGLDTKKLNWDHFYNPTDWQVPKIGLSIADVNELKIQAQFSDTALASSGVSDVNYYKKLGEIYESNKQLRNTSALGFDSASQKIRVINTTYLLYDYMKKITQSGYVILVPHSQGNAYVEAVYSIFHYLNDAESLKKIRVVGLAPVSAKPPRNNYIRASLDHAINFYQTTLTSDLIYYKPAPPTIDLCYKDPCTNGVGESTTELQKITNDSNFHSFTDVYLNPRLYSGDGITPSTWNLPYEVYLRISAEISEIATQKSAVSTVSSISPTTVAAGEVTTFTVAGTNLPTNDHLDVGFGGCANIAFTLTTTNLHKFTCTPQGAGTSTVYIRTIAGGMVLKSQTVSVTGNSSSNNSSNVIGSPTVGLVNLKSNGSLPSGNAYDTVEWTVSNFSKSVTIFLTYENPSLYINGHAFSFINGNFFVGLGNTPSSSLNWVPLNYAMPSNGTAVWAVLIDETDRSRWGYVKLR
jgi:hypothetical protein